MNNVTVKNMTFQKSSTAIGVHNSLDISITQNSMIGTGYAVSVVISSNVSITQNSMKSSGVYLKESNKCSIIKNFLNNASTGIHVYESTFEAKYNRFSQGSVGIEGQFNDCIVVGNVFSGFSHAAILGVGLSNRIVGNSFENNQIGIKQYHSPENVLEKSEMYHNNFINNEQHLFLLNGSHILDSDKGNYYSDYKGTDSDGDGIGDTPFVTSYITHTTPRLYNDTFIDNCPLMEPVETGAIPEFPSWTILPLVLTVTLFLVIIKRNISKPENLQF